MSCWVGVILSVGLRMFCTVVLLGWFLGGFVSCGVVQRTVAGVRCYLVIWGWFVLVVLGRVFVVIVMVLRVVCWVWLGVGWCVFGF